ncbi:ABC transporter substrate-binding protein [Pseudonocardia sp. GCM10023141]|uniref:ABC transporter substrate-binding protein n=1 Tax=Pseudonocardia sp. GCM10023141 TaxID=3252653 RepID=UPI00362038DC
MRKSLALPALAAALALALAACGLGSTAPAAAPAAARAPELAPGQQVSIVLESYNFGQAGAWNDTFTALLAAFHQKYPNITVTGQKPQGGSANPATDSVSSVQAQLATGNPPDVAQLGFSDLDFAVSQLGAKSLDDLVGADAVKANFGGTLPFAPKAATLGDVDGKTYGVPFVFSTPVLFYNASLFKAAGLDPAKPPTTWDEVKADGLAIAKVTGKDGAYVDCVTKAAKDWCLQSVVRSNGGRVISPDQKTLEFADAPAVQAVAMLQDLVTSGASPKLSQAQAVDAFGRGTLGMILESSALQGTFTKGAQGAGWDLRGTGTPAFAGKPVVPTNSGAALFVLSKDPAKQRAAWDLITFLTSPEAYVQISSKIGYLPLRTGLVDDPAGLQAWAAKNPLVRTNLDQMAVMEPWASFPGTDYVQIRDGMMAAVEQVVLQGSDPATTLKAAADRQAPLLKSGQ